jgi:hypothetical protein
MLPRRGGFEGDEGLSLSSILSFLKDLENTVVVTDGDIGIFGMVLGDGAPILRADSGGLSESSV